MRFKRDDFRCSTYHLRFARGLGGSSSWMHYDRRHANVAFGVLLDTILIGHSISVLRSSARRHHPALAFPGALSAESHALFSLYTPHNTRHGIPHPGVSWSNDFQHCLFLFSLLLSTRGRVSADGLPTDQSLARLLARRIFGFRRHVRFCIRRWLWK